MHFNFGNLLGSAAPLLTQYLMAAVLAAATAALGKAAAYLHHKTVGIKNANLRTVADGVIDTGQIKASALLPLVINAAAEKAASAVAAKINVANSAPLPPVISGTTAHISTEGTTKL